jgi:hypothetical protein
VQSKRLTLRTAAFDIVAVGQHPKQPFPLDLARRPPKLDPIRADIDCQAIARFGVPQTKRLKLLSVDFDSIPLWKHLVPALILVTVVELLKWGD